MRVTCFESDKRFRTQWNLPFVLPGSTRIKTLSDDSVLIALAHRDSLFSVYTTDGVLVRRFGNPPLDLLQYNALSVEVVTNGNLICVFSHFPEIRIYSSDGILIASKPMNVGPVRGQASRVKDLRDRATSEFRTEPIPLLISNSTNIGDYILFTGPRDVAKESEAAAYIYRFSNDGRHVGTTYVSLPWQLQYHVFSDIAIDNVRSIGYAVVPEEHAVLRFAWEDD
jgi:hypothetical protein